jgi:glyoxylase-like metal-dependent hydrolase (beta-lactamase superfamily II)
MLFRQLYDRDTCTLSYLLADESAREAVLIDSVIEQVGRDTRLIGELGLTLVATIETHVHADHITGGGHLRQRTGARFAICATGGVAGADLQLCDGDRIAFGQHSLEVRCTPGHTSSCASYYLADSGMIFTGDTLFIRGCGRTDFQEGDARTLYASVHERIFSLPSETLVYPGHDYNGQTVSTVGEELAFNPRLGGGKTADEFVAIMAGLDLAQPAKIDIAVPANQQCGFPTVPEFQG